MGVLLDNFITFIQIYNEKYNTSYSKDDIKYWEFFKELDLTIEDFLNLFYKTFENPAKIPFMDAEAPMYMKKLNQMHEIYLLSALDLKYKEIMKKQLEFYHIVRSIHYKDMIIVPETPYDIKLSHYFKIYIDDNPHLVEPIKKLKDRYLLLYNQPWNQDSLCTDKVIRVSNWREIYQTIISL